MFKFLFGGKKTPEAVPETDREQFKRLTTDLNALIDTLAVKPKVTLDPATGRIELEEPEQFADEALALPAPEPQNAAVRQAESAPEAKTAAEAGDKGAQGDGVAATHVSVPTPPKSNPQPSPPQPRVPEARS
ncbi:hypothetical protein [Gymnodinialimonas ulvae]|uniref:hypothetical protein n=1 Tax=Gymnodinialimonas ulvae TaxID=3126504 RepID=UPI0030ADC2E8